MKHSTKRAATALILTLLGGRTAGAVPSRPVCVDMYNHQYFRYDGRTIPLVGASGEYLPHISNSTQQDFVATLESYPDYVDELVGKGLNTMRIWISLADVATPPLPHETPFCYNPVVVGTSYTCDNSGPNKWDLDRWDSVYFANLKAVIAYAAKGGRLNDTSKAVIVEVTLFDSFSGAFDGPWVATNNLQGYGFTDRTYISAYETSTGDNAANQQARTKQVALMKKVALELKDSYNVYWELANEPDLRGSQGAIPNKTAWATFMANELYNYETTLGKHHLIGVNFHHTTALANAGANSKIQIVNSHYVDLNDTISPSRLSATQMIRANNGTTSGFDKIFGFNEGRITPSYLPLPVNFYVKPEATRAEAWEFMLNGGGVFDHLGYDWRGTTEPVQVRTELGRLNTFLNGFNLRKMDRSPLNGSEVPTWAPGLPAYGSARGDRSLYWAAMQESNRVLLLYIHHSGLSNHSFMAYTPCRPSESCSRSPLTTLKVQMPNVGTNYTAVWINPATLAQIGSSSTVPGNGTLFNVPVPAYPDFDVVLKLTANLPTLSLPCDCMGDTCF